jgi:hypothetical protein
MRTTSSLAILMALTVATACGDDGGGPGADPDAAVEPPNCEATLSGCRCDSAAAPELDECSATSVASAGSLGYCCDIGSCECYEVECWMQTGVTCSCGNSFVVGGFGTQVQSCTGTHCCVDADAKYCFCSVQECDVTDTEVASCSMLDVANCYDFETPTDRCR